MKKIKTTKSEYEMHILRLERKLEAAERESQRLIIIIVVGMMVCFIGFLIFIGILAVN